MRYFQLIILNFNILLKQNTRKLYNLDIDINMSYQKNFIVEVQHCQNCYLHSWCSRHDQNKYDDHFQKVKANAEDIFPNVQVVRNRPPTTYDKIGELGSKGQTKYFDLKSQQIINFPRFGAFQIYVNGNLIFSKIQSNLWPKHDRIAKIFSDILNQSQQSGNIQKFSLQYRLKNDHDEYFVDTYKKLIKRQFSASRRPLSQNQSHNTYSQYLDNSPSPARKGNFISRKVHQSASKKGEQVSRQSRSRKIEYRKQPQYFQYGNRRPQTNVNPRKQQIVYKSKNGQENVRRQLELQNSIKATSQYSSQFKGSPIRTKLKILKQGSQLKPIGKSPQIDHLKKGGRRVFRNTLKQQPQQKTIQKKAQPIKVNNFIRNQKQNLQDQRQKKRQKEFQSLKQRQMSDKEFIQEIKRIDEKDEQPYFNQRASQGSEQTVQILSRKMKSNKDQIHQNVELQKTQKDIYDTDKNVVENLSNREEYQEQTYEDLIRQENNEDEIVQQEEQRQLDRNKSPSIDQMVHQLKKNNKKTQQLQKQKQNEDNNIQQFSQNKDEQVQSKLNGWNSSKNKANQMPTQNQLQKYTQQKHGQDFNRVSAKQHEPKQHIMRQNAAENQKRPEMQKSLKEEVLEEYVEQEFQQKVEEPVDNKTKDKVPSKMSQKALQKVEKLQNKPRKAAKTVQKIIKKQQQPEEEYEFQQNLQQSKEKMQAKNDLVQSYLEDTQDKILMKLTAQQNNQHLNKKQQSNKLLEKDQQMPHQPSRQTGALNQKHKQIDSKVSAQVQVQYTQEFLQEQVPNMQRNQNFSHLEDQGQIRPQSRDSRHSSRRLLNANSNKNNSQVAQELSVEQKEDNNKNQSVVQINQEINNHSAFKKQKTSQIQRENEHHVATVQKQKQLQEEIEKSKEEQYEDLLYEDQNQQSQSIPIIVSKHDGTSKIIEQGIQKDFSPSQVKLVQDEHIQQVQDRQENLNNQKVAHLAENKPEKVNQIIKEEQNQKGEMKASHTKEELKNNQQEQQKVYEFQQLQVQGQKAQNKSYKSDKFQKQSVKELRQNQQEQEGTAKLIQTNINQNLNQIYDEQVNQIHQSQKHQEKHNKDQSKQRQIEDKFQNEQVHKTQKLDFQQQQIEKQQAIGQQNTLKDKQLAKHQTKVNQENDQKKSQQDSLKKQQERNQLKQQVRHDKNVSQEQTVNQQHVKQQQQKTLNKQQVGQKECALKQGQYEQVSKAQLEQLLHEQPKEHIVEQSKDQTHSQKNVIIQQKTNQKILKQRNLIDGVIQEKFQLQRTDTKLSTNKEIVHDYIGQVQDQILQINAQQQQKNQSVNQNLCKQQHKQEENLPTKSQKIEQKSQIVQEQPEVQTQTGKQNKNNEQIQDHNLIKQKKQLQKDTEKQNLPIQEQSVEHIHTKKQEQIFHQQINHITQNIQKNQQEKQKNPIQVEQIVQENSQSKVQTPKKDQQQIQKTVKQLQLQKKAQEEVHLIKKLKIHAKIQENQQQEVKQKPSEKIQEKIEQKKQETTQKTFKQITQQKVQHEKQQQFQQKDQKIPHEKNQEKAQAKFERQQQKNEKVQTSRKTEEKVQERSQNDIQKRSEGKLQELGEEKTQQKLQEKIQEKVHQIVHQKEEKHIQKIKQTSNQNSSEKIKQNKLKQANQQIQQNLQQNKHQKIGQDLQQEVSKAAKQKLQNDGKHQILQTQHKKVQKSHQEEFQRQESNITTNKQIVSEYVNQISQKLQNQVKQECLLPQKQEDISDKGRNIQISEQLQDVKEVSNKASPVQNHQANESIKIHEEKQSKQNQIQAEKSAQNIKLQQQQKQVVIDKNNSLYEQRFNDIKLGVNSKKDIELLQQLKAHTQGSIDKSQKKDQNEKQKHQKIQKQQQKGTDKQISHHIQANIGLKGTEMFDKKQDQNDLKEQNQIKHQNHAQNQQYDRKDSKLTTNKEIVENYVQEINQKVTKIDSEIEQEENHQKIPVKESESFHKTQQNHNDDKKETLPIHNIQIQQAHEAKNQKDEHSEQYSRVDSRITTNKQIVSEYVQLMNEKVEQQEKAQVQVQKQEEKPVPRLKLMTNMQKNILGGQEEVIVNH